jgi:L-fucose isomerase-like protein
MYITPKIGYVTVFNSYEEGANKAQEIHNQGLTLIKKQKCVVIPISEPVNDLKGILDAGELFRKENIDAIIVRLATWSSDTLILNLISTCDVPIVNWGLEDMNSGSMCGAQQFNAVLKELDKNCKFIYKDTPESLELLFKYIFYTALIKNLKQVRFGLIGNRTQGMAEVICDEFSLKEILGPQVISIGLDVFKKECENQKLEPIKSTMKKIRNLIPNINVSEAELTESIKNYLGLKQFITREQLSGVTIDCYPNYMGKVCLGFSLLADEGIIGACEADLNSAVLMWIMQNLSGSPVHHIDPNYLYDEDDSLIGCHCGAGSIQLADDLENTELNHVRLANAGCCVMYTAKPGIVTMANLIGRKSTYRMAIIAGKAVRTERIFPGNPIRIEFPFPIQQFLDLVEAGGFGHHWVVAYGDCSDQLEKICETLNIDALNFNNQ